MKNDIQAVGVNPFLSGYIIFNKNGSQRMLRSLTVERANHNDETTVLLFFNKQQGNTVLTGQRHATIS